MWSRYFNYTTCIRCDDLTVVEQAIANLLEREGGSRLGQLPPLEGSPEQIKEDGSWKQRCIWMVSLFSGKDGWTTIKTWPTELLCHRSNDGSRPQLSALAMQLGCDAFHLSVYEDILGMLMEVNAAGEIHVVGAFDANFAGESFYQQPIDSTEMIEQFSLLEVPESFQAAMRVNEDPEIARKEAEYDRMDKEKNPDWQLLNELWWDVVGKGHTERIDHALAQAMGASDYWYLCPLVFYYYVYPEELAAAGAHLLYFQPPTNYKRPPAYTLTREQWLELFGDEPPEDD